MQAERVHTLDWMMVGAVVLSQIAIGWLFFGAWRRKLSAKWFGVLTAGLLVIWALSGYGVFLNVMAATHRTSREAYPPAASGLRSLASSTELMWGMFSCIAIAVYG